MISSEVQRTLVKSPPELWAELSDPDALARHLGALGEIRITRAEPEKLVEWEATGTSGSVHIKPSGWGTKVTLSVTREVAVDEQPAVEADADDANLGPGAGANLEPGTGANLEPGAGADDEPAAAVGEPAAEAQADVNTQADPDVETQANPDVDTQADPDVETQADIEAQPEAEADEPAIAETEASPVEQALEPDPVSIESPAERELSTEPRRGFFARLFGRRRAKVIDHAAPQPPEELREGPVADADADAGAAEPAPERTSAEPQAQPAGTAIESLQARFAAAEPAVEEPVQPASIDEPAESAQELPAQTPEEPAQASQEPAQTSKEPEEPAQAAPDLAAELQAAEEVAAEEVTAVLTAVLDRLGAAHHRPFSRA